MLQPLHNAESIAREINAVKTVCIIGNNTTADSATVSVSQASELMTPEVSLYSNS